MNRLKDKVVIVTGASSGIGRAASIAFAREGAKIVMAARREQELLKIKTYIKKFNKNCIIQKTDVTSETDIKKLFKAAINRFGTIDIVVNNAGRGLPAKINNITFDAWSDIIHTNLTSVFLCTREAIKHMISKKSKKKGHIITVSSVAGLYGAPGFSAYCASKHGVTGFQRSAKLELWKKGIKVSTIFPARVQTEFFNNYAKQPARSQMLSAKDIGNYIVTVAKGSLLLRAAARMKLLLKRIHNFIKY